MTFKKLKSTFVKSTASTMSCFRKKFILYAVDESCAQLYKDHQSAYGGDAGIDLFVAKDVTIKPGETVLVDTGIVGRCRSVSKCPWHWVCGKMFKYHSFTMFPRSSIYKTPLILHNSVGLIDSNYTGMIKMPLRNLSSEPYTVVKGVRLCQLVTKDLSNAFVKIKNDYAGEECGCCTQKKGRGSNGFGSSGK